MKHWETPIRSKDCFKDRKSVASSKQRIVLLLRSFLPAPSIREYVRSVGIVHFSFPAGSLIPPKPYAPRPETSLYFFPRDPEFIAYADDDKKSRRPSACIYGQHTVLNKRYVGQNFLVLIVHFQPGVLHRLTGIPLDEITNTSVEANQLLTKEVDFVNEQLNDCTSYAEMILVVEKFVLKLIRNSRRNSDRIDRAAQYLLQNHRNVSVEWLAKETCLCIRQFERKFKERNGVSASMLGRIKRFNYSTHIKNANPGMDLLDVALNAGYFDYQHMVRDYKQFTAVTPPRYYDLDTNAPERTFGLSEEDRLYNI